MQALSEIGRVRTYVNTSYAIKLFSDRWWEFSFYGNWDNKPPASISGSDSGSNVSIIWTFN